MTVAATRPKYSVTSLVIYETCPLQYYYTFVRRIPPPPSRARDTGVSIHKLIKDHFAQPTLLPSDADPELQTLLETFKRSRFNVSPVVVEQAFVLPFEAGDVTGRIDLVLPRSGGGLEVVDFKSGTAHSPERAARSLQLPLYALAISRYFDLRPEDVSYSYFFLREGIEASFVCTSDGIVQLSARVENVLLAIQQERFGGRSNCNCHACRWNRRWRARRR